MYRKLIYRKLMYRKLICYKLICRKLIYRKQPFTTHATLLKGGAVLPNLRIPILPSKTIVFSTPKTQLRLLSKLEVDLFS